MTEGITVVIPVGPYPANKQWLGECLDSVRVQTLAPAAILIIDDMAGLCQGDVGGDDVTLWRTPWLSGVAHSFNFGVALAETERVFMLGSDDRLEPWCLADCAAEWERQNDPLGYYHVDLRYEDTGEVQTIACGAAMVTKALWQHTGGFPVQAAIGASDTMLGSIILGARGLAGRFCRVESPQGAPYLYRSHEGSDTRRNFWRFHEAIASVRDTLTREWQPWVEGRPVA